MNGDPSTPPRGTPVVLPAGTTACPVCGRPLKHLGGVTYRCPHEVQACGAWLVPPPDPPPPPPAR